MTDYQFLCEQHRVWVDANPQQAFERVEAMSNVAEQLVKESQFERAIPYLGTALESAEILFEKRLESPQLTTKITSLAITLANAYEVQSQVQKGVDLLLRIEQKFRDAIACAEGYATKAAFFRHCSAALNEAQCELKQSVAIIEPIFKGARPNYLH